MEKGDEVMEPIDYGDDVNIENYTKWGGKTNLLGNVPWKDATAKKYGVYDAANWMMRDLFKSLDVEPESAFEIGCGFGRNLKMLKAQFPDMQLVGCDITPTQIEFAHDEFLKDVDVRSYLNCGTKIPEGDNSYDVVYTVSVLQHVMKAKFPDIIDEICRISKGTILHFENYMEITQRFGIGLIQTYEKRGYKVVCPDIKVWSEPEQKDIRRPGCLFVVTK